LRNQNLLSFFFFFSQGVSVPSIIPWYQFLIFWLLAKEDMLRSSGIQRLHHRDLRLHLQRLTKATQWSILTWGGIGKKNMVVEWTWKLSMEGMCTSNFEDAMAASMEFTPRVFSNLDLETNLVDHF
jgi:hypothetical protein